MFTRTESLSQFIRFYPIVSIIIAIHLALFLAATLPIFPNYWLIDTFGGGNLYIAKGEYWRLLTPIFLHSGFTHVLFNSFSLVLFGPGLERMLGPGKFIFVYLISGIAANFATYLLEPLTYTHVGSSGAIFGLFGYYAAIVLLQRRAMARQDSQTIMTIAVISVIMTFLQPNINITAHLFGLLSGFLLGAAARRR